MAACSVNPADYDAFCPSGSCVCDTYSGTVNGPLLGHGTIDITLTVDTGAATPNLTAGCKPFFGVVSFSARRDSETENVTGTVCTNFSSSQKASVIGGFEIVSSAIGEAGWGTLGGNLYEAVSPALLTLQLKAHITP